MLFIDPGISPGRYREVCVCALADWSKQCNENRMGAAREFG